MGRRKKKTMAERRTADQWVGEQFFVQLSHDFLATSACLFLAFLTSQAASNGCKYAAMSPLVHYNNKN
jgi:hypothetical protein